jgi:hypothetical protein
MMPMLEYQQVLVYSETISNRLAYIIQTLFKGQANLTTDLVAFAAFDGLKINYSIHSIEHAQLHIYPHGLLEQQHIASQTIELIEWNGQPAFFATPGDIPFDLFAAAFYLMTRYEEYLPHQTDHLGRYLPTQSLAYQAGFLQKPLVNFWIRLLTCIVPIDIPQSVSIQPSYDIDIAYSYLHHPILKNTLGYFKDLLNQQFGKLTERLQVLGGIQADPYDVYNWLLLLHDSLQLKPIYFFLASAKNNQLHKQVQLHAKGFQDLIKQHAQQYAIGLHPSATKTNVQAVWKIEQQTLEAILQSSVTKSRQHYIFLSFPETYSTLIEMGIQEDYSMGYPQINGFRASYTDVFNWFNLSTNTITQLKVYPFCYMDATAIFNEKLTVEAATKQLDDFFELYQLCGGKFIPIFHNNFLTDQPEFQPWRHMYADFLIKHCTKYQPCFFNL